MDTDIDQLLYHGNVLLEDGDVDAGPSHQCRSAADVELLSERLLDGELFDLVYITIPNSFKQLVVRSMFLGIILPPPRMTIFDRTIFKINPVVFVGLK